MSVIKQISIFNGSSWDQAADIGANAGNIDIATSAGSTVNIAGSSNLYTGLTNILPASRLTANTALISGSDQKITSSSVTSTLLGYLSGTTENIQTALSTLNTRLEKRPLTIVPASSNHTINKGWAFEIANIAFVSLQMISTAQITAGATGLFRLDYAANRSISPDIANNGSQSGTTVTVPLYLCYDGKGTVTSAIASGGHIYINSQSTIPANTTIYISGCFVCHNQN